MQAIIFVAVNFIELLENQATVIADADEIITI
jgi:hypothetical protein